MRTLVADVCRYQNDGTENITPSHFIERAEAENDGWHEELDAAVTAFLAGDGEIVLKNVAKKIADDILIKCDRVKTGQLKLSFQGKIKRGNR